MLLPKPATNKGIVLPLVIVLSLIVLTSMGIWYRKMIVHGFLAERVIQQRIAFKECNTLVPILKNHLESVPLGDLKQADEHFFAISVQGEQQWAVSRSAWIDGKIIFNFKSATKVQEPVRLTIGYSRSDD
jgi:hypothetical protein